jgi:hypothetical protein
VGFADRRERHTKQIEEVKANPDYSRSKPALGVANNRTSKKQNRA